MKSPLATLSQRFFLDRYLVPVLTAVATGVLLTTLVVYFYTKYTVQNLAQGQIAQALNSLDRVVAIQSRDMAMQVKLLSQEEVLLLCLEDSYLGRSALVAGQRKIEGYVRNGSFERIYIMDPAGKLVLTSDPTWRSTLKVADRSYFTKAMTGQSTMETVAVSRVTGRPILVASTPMRDANGLVVGVAVGIMHTAQFAREMMDEGRFGNSGGAYILSADGELLAEPSWTAPGQFNPTEHAPQLIANVGNKDFTAFNRNGANRLSLSQRNEVTGWVLVVEAAEGEILAPARQLAAVSGTISFITMALVVMALGVLRRVMTSLRDSEADHRTLTEISPVGIVTFGPGGNPEYMNRQARSILRLGPEDELPAQLTLVDSEGAPLVGAASPIAQVLSEKQSVIGLLTWYASPDGNRKILHLNATPLVVQGREAHGVVATLEDITERMQALEQLNQSEERFSSLFRLSPDSIILTEMDSGVIVDVNDAFVDSHGYSREELLGRSILELDFYVDDRQRLVIQESVARDGHILNYETKGRTKDGREIVHSLSSQLMEIGESHYRLTVLRDVTEHTKAVERLKQSEERFSRLFRLSPESIVLVDLEDSRFADVNEAFLKLTGYSHDELIGKSSVEIGFYVDDKRRKELYELLARNGHVENYEFEGKCKDGQVLQCSITCHVIVIEAKQYLMAMVRDVTDLKKMQTMMIQTEKMLSVGGIAAGIAHEINNPLGIVLQAAQNLVQRTNPEFKKNIETAAALGLDMNLLQKYMQARKLDAFIEDIQSAAVRASAIIRHMLDFSRSSESKRKVCDIASIVDRAIVLASSDYDLKKSYDFKRIKIVRDYADDLPSFSCTETEIEQVMLNLLRNSAQALAGCDPPLQEPRISILLRVQGEQLRIEIADNGPGMPLEVQRRVFEPFFTTKPPGVGTGLGLSVSYFIITKGHGGRMSVSSQPGMGTTFAMDLPLDDAKEA